MRRLFGAMKRGAIAVPLFTLFGADGVRLRTRDCTPSLLLTTAEKAAALAGLDGPCVVAADAAFMAALERFRPATSRGPRPATWRFSSIHQAPRAKCRTPSGTPIGRWWW